MKKLINDANEVVAEALAGMAAAHPDQLRVDPELRIVYRRQPPTPGKVGLVSGGGCGHEPLHAGFVGLGMLDAACCGEVFTSPVPDQVLAATRTVAAGAGVLHIVKNYTGDVLNFEMACEMAAAAGIRVATVVVDDDVAVQDSLSTSGRRGVGTTVLVEKIAGAGAEQGRDLDSVRSLAARVAAQGRSMGVALSSCTVPTAGRPTFGLGDDEIEVGVGIHGEPGQRRVLLGSAREVAQLLVEPILADLDFRGSDTILLLNGMGATPLAELYLMYQEVNRILAASAVRVARNLVGNYITSLEMAGCSVTLLKADADMLSLWDAPVMTPGLRWGC